MAFIKISELRLAGAELFDDTESFLHELTDEATEVIGGDVTAVLTAVPFGKSRIATQLSKINIEGSSFATASLFTALG